MIICSPNYCDVSKIRLKSFRMFLQVFTVKYIIEIYVRFTTNARSDVSCVDAGLKLLPPLIDGHQSKLILNIGVTLPLTFPSPFPTSFPYLPFLFPTVSCTFPSLFSPSWKPDGVREAGVCGEIQADDSGAFCVQRND